MSIEREAPEPLYLQLAAIIRSQIGSGQLPSRTRVPSISYLAAEHDLATVTVRRAMNVLRTEGLITTVPGRGTFVA
jgi:DNA-binding GntR family transcriptional regulator